MGRQRRHPSVRAKKILERADGDETVHLANLYDMGEKYAELQKDTDILGWLE